MFAAGLDVTPREEIGPRSLLQRGLIDSHAWRPLTDLVLDFRRGVSKFSAGATAI